MGFSLRRIGQQISNTAQSAANSVINATVIKPVEITAGTLGSAVAGVTTPLVQNGSLGTIVQAGVGALTGGASTLSSGGFGTFASLFGGAQQGASNGYAGTAPQAADIASVKSRPAWLIPAIIGGVVAFGVLIFALMRRK